VAEKQTLRLFLGSFVEFEPIHAEFACPTRFVRPENLHLTWRYFGETGEKELPGILDKIGKTVSNTGEISIKFNRYELWPNARYPRLLVLAGDDVNGNATELYRAFNDGKFRPHVTVARFKLKQRLAQPVELPNGAEFPEEIINFREISLLSSTLTPKGSIYGTIKSYKL